MQTLSLSDKPNSKLIEYVEKFGGKLGVLQLIAELYDNDPKPFDEIGIRVGFEHIPTILTINEEFTGNTRREILQRYSSYQDSPFILRGSLPGDYRSFIDVVPTVFLQKLENINQTIANVRKNISDIVPNLLRYAELSRVPFHPDQLVFGLVPKFGYGHLVVTENPNLPGEYIAEVFFVNGFRPDRVDIGSNSLLTEKINRLVTHLRGEGILDNEIAYSFELGQDESMNTILYQVREFCRKFPIESGVLKLKDFHTNNVHAVLTTIPPGRSKEFKIGNTIRDEIMDPVCHPVFAKSWFSPHSSFDITNLDPNQHGMMTESYRLPTIGGHNIMRQAQYALQSERGGIVVLGTDSDGYGSYVKNIGLAFAPKKTYDDMGNRTFEEPRLGSAVISHDPDGCIIIA